MSMTFTKLFSSITESTVWMESDQTRLVWIAMLAMADRHGRVWGSVPGLANRARVPVEATRKALTAFLSPDADSRTKLHDGKRIEEIDGGWRLLNHEKYRAIRDEESIKESKRKYINERRRRERVEKNSTVELGRANAEAEPEANAEAEIGVITNPKNRAFTPPSPEEVTAYSVEIGYEIDGQAWCDSYEQKGWMVGKNRMKSWKAAVRNWKANGWLPSLKPTQNARDAYLAEAKAQGFDNPL